MDSPFGQVRDAGEEHRPLHGGGALRIRGAPASPVGVAAELDDVAHAQPVGDVAALGEQGDVLGEVGALHQQRVVVPAGGVVDRQAPVRDVVQARQRAEQGGLAAAVGADQRHDAPRFQAHARPVDDFLTPVAEHEAVSCEPGFCVLIDHAPTLA